MRRSDTKKNLQKMKKGQGMERESVIRNGGTWMKPTVTFDMKKKYNRKRQKSELRRLING